LVEVVCSVFSEAAVLYVEREERPGRKSSHDLLLSLLDTLHNVLTSTSRVVRIALQGAESQGETQAAEDLLLINKPLTQLTSLLIQMLPCEDAEVYEETSQCLSLLMQLYGGDSPDSLSPLNLQSLSHALQLQTQPKQHRLLLRIIKRLVGWLGATNCTVVPVFVVGSDSELAWRNGRAADLKPALLSLSLPGGGKSGDYPFQNNSCEQRSEKYGSNTVQEPQLQ
ncbi:serine/threonine-protein kinase ULK4-like, partial [Oncorhynchus keta]|uniref:serine/threonine-protein kinase ULK4-like n=1 Tax=Oncorhynchus keta TaxID=8018 RepID=UPI00227B0416